MLPNDKKKKKFNPRDCFLFHWKKYLQQKFDNILFEIKFSPYANTGA